MELKISKFKSDPQEPVTNKITEKLETVSIQNNAPVETLCLENGINLHKQGDIYSVSVGDEHIAITEEEAILIYNSPDSAYDIIVNKTRKFYFNVSEDTMR